MNIRSTGAASTQIVWSRLALKMWQGFSEHPHNTVHLPFSFCNSLSYALVFVEYAFQKHQSESGLVILYVEGKVQISRAPQPLLAAFSLPFLCTHHSYPTAASMLFASFTKACKYINKHVRKGTPGTGGSCSTPELTRGREEKTSWSSLQSHGLHRADVSMPLPVDKTGQLPGGRPLKSGRGGCPRGQWHAWPSRARQGKNNHCMGQTLSLMCGYQLAGGRWGSHLREVEDEAGGQTGPVTPDWQWLLPISPGQWLGSETERKGDL